MWSARIIALVGCVLLGGCQQEAAPGDVPVTPEALAWVSADHFGPPTSASGYPAASRRIGAGAVAAQLAYDEAITVAVLPALDVPVCDAALLTGADECLETKAGFLAWDLAEEGEDPGQVAIVVPKGDSWAVVVSSGPDAITDDPRQLDLAISVDDMFELAHDPRLDLTTTQEAVDGGKELDYWGKPDL